MAAVLGEAWVEISAPLTRLGRDLSRAQSMVDRSSSVMASRMGRVGAAMSSIGSKMTLGVTLPLIAAMGASVKAAIDKEKAINELNNALKGQGVYTKAVSDELVKYAEAMMRVTVYDDEVIMSGMALAINLKGNADKMKDVTKAAIGLSYMFNMDLGRAFEVAGRGSEGIAFRLLKLGIKLKEGATDAEIWAAVWGKGSKGMAGAMAYAANTTEGQMLQLKNAIGEVEETIGNDLLPTLTKLAHSLTGIANFVEKMPSSTILWGFAIAGIAGPILKIIALFVQWRLAAAAAMVATSLAGGAGVGGIGKVAAGAAVGVAGKGLLAGILGALGIALPIAAGGALGVVSGMQGMKRAREGQGMGWNPLSWPGYGIEKWGNARIAGMETGPGRLPKDYVKGAIRMQEPGMGGMTKEQGDEVIRQLKEVAKHSGRYQ